MSATTSRTSCREGVEQCLTKPPNAPVTSDAGQDELDLKVPGNIGDEKLKARIEEAKAALNGSGAANAPAAGEQTSPR